MKQNLLCGFHGLLTTMYSFLFLGSARLQMISRVWPLILPSGSWISAETTFRYVTFEDAGAPFDISLFSLLAASNWVLGLGSYLFREMLQNVCHAKDTAKVEFCAIRSMLAVGKKLRKKREGLMLGCWETSCPYLKRRVQGLIVLWENVKSKLEGGQSFKGAS